jgi:hypothetical protein
MAAIRHTAAGRAAGCAACLACLLASSAWAGSWGSEASVAASAEYNSNPRMQRVDATSATSAALAVDLPATYTGDSQTLDLRPRFRVATTHGDTGLLSDYQYLDATWRLASERNALQATGTWHRDSTLYNQLENTATLAGVLRRAEQTAGLQWQRQLTERTFLRTDASWNRVAYEQRAQSGLTDYQYRQASVQLVRDLSERLQGSLGAGVGRYESFDHSYRSDSPYLQVGFNRSLSEQWSLNMAVGVSQVQARSQFGPFVFKSSQNSSTYSMSLAQQRERGSFSASLTRAIQPSGYGAQVVQDDASIARSFPWSERWTGNASLHATRIADPLRRLSVGERRYYGAEVSAAWQSGEHWTVTMQADYYRQQFDSGSGQPHNTALYLTLTRQYGRKSLQ